MGRRSPLFPLCVLAFAAASATLLAQPRESTKPAQAQAPPVVFVRGFVVTDVAPGATAVTFVAANVKSRPRVVYVPGAVVVLRKASGVGPNLLPAVRTDLSGRFTLRGVRGDDRYLICVTAPGFDPACRGVTVGGAGTYLGLFPIAPHRTKGQATLWGRVRMLDGTAPRTLDGLANINAFARVTATAAGGRPFAGAYVDNFGEYVIPAVPGHAAVTLTATVENGLGKLAIQPAAALGDTPVSRIDLTIRNHRPMLTPILPFDGAGNRVGVARPGEKVILRARAVDDDGDVLKYSWQVVGGAINPASGQNV